MSTNDDAAQLAAELGRVAADALAALQSPAMKVAAEDLQRQSAMLSNEVLANVRSSVANLAKAMQPSIVTAVQQLAKVGEQQRAAIEAMQSVVSKLLANHRVMVEAVAGPAESLRRQLQAMSEVTNPAIRIDPAIVAALRGSATNSVAALDESVREPFLSAIDSLQRVERAATEEHSEIPTEHLVRDNRFIILAVLTILINFLGAQRRVLETTFTDVALLGAAVTHFWQYAMALVALVVSYRVVKD